MKSIITQYQNLYLILFSFLLPINMAASGKKVDNNEEAQTNHRGFCMALCADIHTAKTANLIDIYQAEASHKFRQESPEKLAMQCANIDTHGCDCAEEGQETLCNKDSSLCNHYYINRPIKTANQAFNSFSGAEFYHKNATYYLKNYSRKKACDDLSSTIGKITTFLNSTYTQYIQPIGNGIIKIKEFGQNLFY